MEIRPGIEMCNIAPPAEPQVIQAPDLAAAFEQAIAKMAADKTGAACHQNSQGLYTCRSSALHKLLLREIRLIEYHFRRRLQLMQHRARAIRR